MMLALIRPDSWNLPLFLHVLGAITVFGSSATLAIAGFAGRRDSAHEQMLARVALRTFLFGVTDDDRSADPRHGVRAGLRRRLVRDEREALTASRTTASCGNPSSSQSAVSWIPPAAAGAIVSIVASQRTER